MKALLPSTDVDPFGDETLAHPYEWYRWVRDTGPVVYVSSHDVYAVGRFHDLRTALRDWRTFSSKGGPGFNDLVNELSEGTSITMEPPDHDTFRAVLNKYLRLSETRTLAPMVHAKAEQLVAQLLEHETFDGIGELAEPMVAGVVGEMLGLSTDLINPMVEASKLGFNIIGPMNARASAALETVLASRQIIENLQKSDFRQGSSAWGVVDLMERGDVPKEMRERLLHHFTGPAFDTTINAIGSMLWLLATHPDQWALVKNDHSLIPATINEALRIESPIQRWGRTVPQDVEIDGSPIPAGSRILALIGAANRDERRYVDPDTFDIRRNPADHLSFGNGIHLCVGAPLARQEMTSLLQVLVDRVESLSLQAEPTPRLNNTTRGFETLTLSMQPSNT